MMSWLLEIAARIRSLFLGSQLDRQLEEELDTHVALLIEENVKRGLSPDVARRDALLKVGNRGVLKEIHRDNRSLRVLDDFARDVRHSIRLLRRNPLFAIVASLSLAIGIGADATVFTMANSLLFRSPEGVTDPSQLVDVSRTMRGQFGVFEISYPDFRQIRERASTLAGVYFYEPMSRPMTMVGSDGAEPVFGTTVSPNYFEVLGVSSTAGQLFEAERIERSGMNSVVVLSHEFWRRRFNGDPGIIGKTIQVDGEALQVTGIASESFHGTSIVASDIWVSSGSSQKNTMRSVGWFFVGGRLKTGVTVGEAAAELSAIGIALQQDYPNEHQGAGLKVTSLSMIPANLVLAVAGIFTLLMAFVSLVLLIACGNMASVLLSRAATRRGELAVRLAIGAGRGRVARQLLTETTVSFTLGAAGGLLLSRGLTALVISRIPNSGVPIHLSTDLDTRIVLFTLGLSFIAAILCGLMPALHASKPDVISALKSDGQNLTRRSRVQNAFVIGQVALSIVLVVAAGLFLHALEQVSSVPLGYDPKNVETATIDLSSTGRSTADGPNFIRNFIRELRDRLRGLPGVQASTICTLTPLEAGRVVVDLKPAGNGAPAPRLPDPSMRVSWNSVDPGYFATMRIPFLAGRDFSVADVADSQSVAIVSERTARRLWPGQNPVGQYLPATLGDLGNGALVIGVVRDVTVIGGPQASPPVVYRPLMQRYFPRLTIAARTVDGHRLAIEFRALVSTINPDVSILKSETLESGVDAAMAPQRNAAALTGSLGIVGLLLASVGVYGISAYAVTRRTREIGIRIALGAQRSQVTRLVLREGMSLVAVGSGIGLLVAYGASRAMRVSPLDVPAPDFFIFIGAAVLFLIVGLIACWTPVRRATRIDAMLALRHD